ncbi:arylsulfatase [uncultured Draconibacterium sp.]|uniref:sulfatase family protein n=1 Tax=uncultured Draconibacterium sp. TaxID=1573823 RepID=UPI0025DB6904|nr:arylsulfatase [uncultured Draconibacterium sp.]
MLKRFLLYFLVQSFVVCVFAGEKPNVIVVLADDIGTGDISHYRSIHSSNIILETPNIDKLAQSGTVFTQAHAPAALCAPSRYGIMTGNSCYRSPFPWGVWGSYQQSPIKDEDLTLGRLMTQAGYNTAFFGKWHLGGDYYRKDQPGVIYRGDRSKPQTDVDISKIIDGPNQKGFAYSFAYPAGIQAVPYAAYENGAIYPYSDKPVEIGYISQENMSKIGVKLDKLEGLGDLNWNPRNAGPLLAAKGVEYIRTHANKEKPFFMYYCSQAVHLPHNPPAELNGIKIAGTTPSAHMDMIKELDVQMGMLVDELKKQGVYENTVFIFTSDNGGLHVNRKTLESGHQPSDIYRGSKNDMHEGGHRVPFIVSWPAGFKARQESDQLVLGLDIAATLAEIAEVKIQQHQAMDSYSLIPVLKNKKPLKRDFVMLQSGTQKQLIIIENEWKLIIQVDRNDKTDKTRKPIALFNLKENPSELENGNKINDPGQQERIEHLFNKYNTTRERLVRTGS